MKIDIKKLRATIAEDTKRIRELKKKGYRDLDREKLIATRHHAIAAHLHGRIHLSGKFLCNPKAMNLSDRYEPCFLRFGMSKEEQEKFIEKELQAFIVPESAPGEVAPSVG